MLAIKKCIIKDESKESNNLFYYPNLINIYPINKIYDNLIEQINDVIYEDVLAFKEMIDTDEEIINYSYTDYKIGFKQKQIISIAIQFYEISGTQDITYVNTYNYDISKNKILSLNDIFKYNTDYLDLISIEVQNKLNQIIDTVESIYTELSFENIQDFISIYEDQAFYIQPEKITICFSSYELGSKFPKPIEIDILLDDYKEYLTDYAINQILKEGC